MTFAIGLARYVSLICDFLGVAAQYFILLVRSFIVSIYEWERGVIKLPSGVAPKIKKRLVEVQNREYDEVTERVKKFWAENKTTSKKKMQKALHDAWERRYDRQPARVVHGGGLWGLRSTSAYSDELDEKAENVINRVLHTTDGKMRAPKKADIERIVGERANSRTKLFRAGGDAAVLFDGNTVTWEVQENNHAIDRSRNSPIGRAFFSELKSVQWTRGTGGEIVGNNEYNRDSYESGGGANYVTDGFGPLGDPFWKSSRSPRKKAGGTGTHHKRSGTVTSAGIARRGTIAKNPKRKQ